MIPRTMRVPILLGTLLVLLGGVNACKIKKLKMTDPRGISSAQYVLRLAIVPEHVDINSDQSATAKLRARLTTWQGQPMANRTVLFQVLNILINYAAEVDVTTVDRTTETKAACDVNVDDTCINCANAVTTKDETTTTTQQNLALDCQSALDTTAVGRIDTRYVKTDSDGVAETTYFPFGPTKVLNNLQSELAANVLDCAGTQLNITNSSSVDISDEAKDTDNDQVNDTCTRTTTTETTTTTVTILAFDLPQQFEIPIQASWIESNTPDNVSDINNLIVQFPQWNND